MFSPTTFFNFFFILLHIHISKASSLFISFFLVAHVCDPYSMIASVSSYSCLVFLSEDLSSLRMSLLLSLSFFNLHVAFGVSCNHTHLDSQISSPVPFSPQCVF